MRDDQHRPAWRTEELLSAAQVAGRLEKCLRVI